MLPECAVTSGVAAGAYRGAGGGESGAKGAGGGAGGGTGRRGGGGAGRTQEHREPAGAAPTETGGLFCWLVRQKQVGCSAGWSDRNRWAVLLVGPTETGGLFCWLVPMAYAVSQYLLIVLLMYCNVF